MLTVESPERPCLVHTGSAHDILKSLPARRACSPLIVACLSLSVRILGACLWRGVRDPPALALRRAGPRVKPWRVLYLNGLVDLNKAGLEGRTYATGARTRTCGRAHRC